MKPMLATACEDITQVKFPVFASPKLDGVRALVIDGVLMSRSLKPIPNQYAQELFSGLPDGTDGELIVGRPNNDPYRETVSAVMREDGEEPTLNFHIFDNFNLSLPFRSRFECVSTYKRWKRVKIVPHILMENLEDLEGFESKMLLEGFEGTMIRSPNGPYKHGRSTLREGYLLKLKRFKDSEAEVLSVYEQMHNDNEAETNELGRTERSTKKEGMIPAGILGGFEVRDIKSDVEFRIGGGFTLEDRTELWKIRQQLIGRLAKYKYFPTGSKDKPRFPVFIGWRDKIDI